MSARRGLGVLAATVLCVAVLPGVATAGAAPPAPVTSDACADGSLCLFPDADYTGTAMTVDVPAEGDCFDLDRPATSGKNDTSFAVDLFDGADCAGSPAGTLAADQNARSFPAVESVRFGSRAAKTRSDRADPNKAIPATAR